MTATAEPQSALVEESAPTTRCRILAAAERFFREIGYQKTTVADIAKSLGMSPANVYRFFDSKRSINEAVVARVTQEVQAQTAARRGAGDEAGHVGDGVAHVAGRDDAEVGHEGGEGVVRDLGPRRGEHGDQRGLAGAR